MWNDQWSIMKPAYFISRFSSILIFRFSIKWYSGAQKVIQHKYVKYTCSIETVQQNGRFTLFSSKFHSNIYSILYVYTKYGKLYCIFGQSTALNCRTQWKHIWGCSPPPFIFFWTRRINTYLRGRTAPFLIFSEQDAWIHINM